MGEYDLVLMSAVIFTPLAFAVGLLFIPRGRHEWMRWCALLGTAATLILALCMLIDFYAMLDGGLDRNGRPLHSASTQLDARTLEALSRAAQPVPEERLSYDFVSQLEWIDSFDIHYSLALDGISMPLILLTAFVMLLAVVASWNINTSVRGYLILMLTLETGVIGAFMALDFFLFYIFYELMLIPMYFLIGVWGGGQRKYAAIKFVLYTLFGSLLILVAMLGLYLTNVRDFVDQNIVDVRAEQIQRDNPELSPEEARDRVVVHTFNLVTLQKAGQAAALVLNGQQARLVAQGEGADDSTKVEALAPGVTAEEAAKRFDQPFFSSTFQYALFALLFIGFAVKVPLVPLHNWLPDAHVEAPTPISMILAGILLKLGGYGIIRMAFSICPWAAHQLAWWIGLIACIAIAYGAFVAMGQRDFKKLLAYSSVSHMGYVILGIAAWSSVNNAQYWSWGMNGAMFQMVAHGISSAGMFFVVGVIYERAHHRDLSRMGGLKEPMPMYSGLSVVLFLASMGLPGLCGFVGEFFVMMSAWHFEMWFAIVAILTTVITAAYLLWTWQRVYLGVNPDTAKYPDASSREITCLLPFVIMAIALGVAPQLLLSWMEPSATGLVETLANLGK